MRIISRQTLTVFAESLAGQKDYLSVKAALDAWFLEVRRAHWMSSADVKQHYAHASIPDSARCVFNIKGNDYRLVISIDYEKQAVWIKWIGSHRDYDGIDARKVAFDG